MLCLGRHWNARTSTYEDVRSDIDARPAPALPPELVALAARAGWEAGFEFTPDMCIVNWYTAASRMGLHQDKDESPESIAAGAPVVSFSIGDTARFLFGGLPRKDPVEKILLESGDAFVFGGASRLRYHGVTRILPGTAPAALGIEGRFNLTFRQYLSDGWDSVGRVGQVGRVWDRLGIAMSKLIADDVGAALCLPGPRRSRRRPTPVGGQPRSRRSRRGKRSARCGPSTAARSTRATSWRSRSCSRATPSSAAGRRAGQGPRRDRRVPREGHRHQLPGLEGQELPPVLQRVDRGARRSRDRGEQGRLRDGDGRQHQGGLPAAGRISRRAREGRRPVEVPASPDRRPDSGAARRPPGDLGCHTCRASWWERLPCPPPSCLSNAETPLRR